MSSEEVTPNAGQTAKALLLAAMSIADPSAGSMLHLLDEEDQDVVGAEVRRLLALRSEEEDE